MLALAVCVLGAAGCANDVTSPSNLQLVFTAQLSPANEVPPVTSAESAGLGTVQITIDVVRDSTGAITSGTAAFHFQLSGFPDSISLVGAHIHPGVAGVNGPVRVNTGLSAATTVPRSNGALVFNAAGISVTGATVQALVDNPAAFYFNVHSALHPGGVARGQLRRTL
jgi:hypothetical protein